MRPLLAPGAAAGLQAARSPAVVLDGEGLLQVRAAGAGGEVSAMLHLCPNCGAEWQCSDSACPFPKSWPCAPKELATKIGVKGMDAFSVVRQLVKLPVEKRVGAPVDWKIIDGWFAKHPSWSADAMDRVGQVSPCP